MSERKALARNVVWNWAGMATEMLAGFLVMPFLVRHLGTEGYGLWVLIASLTGYFGLLDLGTRSSVGRHMAFHRARREPGRVNEMLSTALAILGASSLVALAGTVAALLAFNHLFAVPPADLPAARIALALVGLNLALSLPLSAFDASLWSFQRFDLLNAVDIPGIMLRAGLTFALVGTGHGLVALGGLTLGVTLATGLTKVALCYRIEPGLRAQPSLVRRSAARTLAGYGVWSFVLSVGRIVASQVTPAIVGARLGITPVAVYSVALRLVGYANSLFATGTGVFTPMVAALQAGGDHARQQRLFLEGSRYAAALSVFIVTCMLALGGPFLALWMGPKMADAVPLIGILALGEALPLSQWMSTSLLLGVNRHRLQAQTCVIENAVVLTLAFLLAPVYGLTGVCLAVAIPGTLCRGVLQMLYACRAIGLPVWRYLAEATLPAAAAGLLPALGLLVLVRWRPPHTWFWLAAYAAAYGLAHLLACGLFLTGKRAATALLARIAPVTDLSSVRL